MPNATSFTATCQNGVDWLLYLVKPADGNNPPAIETIDGVPVTWLRKGEYKIGSNIEADSTRLWCDDPDAP